ncbi:uncharacterized protein LOC128392080 [Panonychus citri]|uniref:uncharacterized protein LOC128392080 n=1 Tax=Panonychus citri TaxID=50023 RepID=UPI002307114B|nr:uncharacterized protein LOC128392080 [Panonychus citri]
MNRFGSLLGQYGATLSKKDVDILREIDSLDGKSSILKYNPFIWGEAAPIFYASIGDTRHSLFQIPKSNHVMGQYKRDQMIKTLEQFPLDLSLDLTDDHHEDRPDLYDPRYILTSLYHLLGPENAVNCNQIIKSFGLSIALVGTSSEIISMRHLSYLVLERLLFHLEASKSLSAVYFWTHFIDCFRASMSSPNQKMPFLLTSLLVKIIETIDTPKDSMFYELKDFVTAKPKFDCDQISSLFINLLLSKDLEWKKCQRFVLNLLARSVRSEQDFEICKCNNLFNYILSIFTSKWVDWLDRILIIQFIKNCSRIPKVLTILVIESGLIVWLTNIVMTSYRSMGSSQRKEITELIEIIRLTCKSTDLPKNSYKKPLMLIKSVIKTINDQEPAPESI